MDPVFVLRIVVEKCRTKNTPLRCLFLDMQKAFEWVPRAVIWWALRSKWVSETYFDMIRDMNHEHYYLAFTVVSDTKLFHVTPKDSVRNSRIRGSLHVRDFAEKLLESRPRWCDHLLQQRHAASAGS